VRIPICIEYSTVRAGPLLMPSRLTDSEQKIIWGDEHWARLPGSGAVAQVVDSNLYLANSLRNSGSGVAVIHGWYLVLQEPTRNHAHAGPDEFRPRLRNLYVPGDDVGFWQAAIRDRRRLPIKPSSVLVALGARIVSSALDAVQ
jgi:hypothetical protein